MLIFSKRRDNFLSLLPVIQPYEGFLEDLLCFGSDVIGKIILLSLGDASIYNIKRTIERVAFAILEFDLAIFHDIQAEEHDAFVKFLSLLLQIDCRIWSQDLAENVA